MKKEGRRYYVELGIYTGKNKMPQIRTEHFYRMSELITAVQYLHRCSGVMSVCFGRNKEVGAIGEWQ